MEQEPLVLDMYTEVSRIKPVFRHFEGVPLPLPVPVTVTGIISAVSWVIVSFYFFPNGDPLTNYILVPVILASAISYFEPEFITPIQWGYAYIRKWIKPTRRIINRSVPPIGYKKVYKQYTIIRKRKGNGFGASSSH